MENEKKELAPVNQVFSSFPTQAEWNTINIIAKTLKEGGVLPKSIDTLPKMVVALQAGREIGLQPMEALGCLYFVNGKIAMYGEAVPNQIMRAGHTITWGDCNAETATVTITRGDNGNTMSQTFTMREAKERGYTKNPIYLKYPENMLKWRALGMVAKFIVPDALKGVSIKENLEAEVIQADSPFKNKKESTRIEDEVVEGTFSKRKSLGDALDEKEPEDKSVPVSILKKSDIREPKKAKPEEVQGFLCDKCDKVCQSKGGLTIHMRSHN